MDTSPTNSSFASASSVKFPLQHGVHGFLYALVIFLGAFLLFAIQPMAGKHILPFFGGSSSVWATSLLFFTTVLFLGYLYVYLLTRQERQRQIFIHAAVLGISVLFGLWSFFSGAYGVASHADVENPSAGVLFVLAFSIGVPFFLLSTTGPLLQFWYALTRNREPYHLYALSNVASFAALLSYPFFVEPVFSLRLQDSLWFLLFLVYAATHTFIAFHFFGIHHEGMQRKAENVGRRKAFLWTALAALPSFLLVSTTTQITQVVAPVPLLWIVPLALYLLSFVLAFKGWGSSIWVALLFLASAILAYIYTTGEYSGLVMQVASHLILLFFCGLYAHGAIYRSRPHAESSPLFYVLLSLGGAVGALAATLLPPLLFPDYWEFTIGLAVAGAVAVAGLPLAFFPRIFDERMVRATKVGLTLSILMLCFRAVGGLSDTPEISSRNFYGNTRVVFAQEATRLMHGSTLHGLQLTNNEDSFLPTTYYTPSSGIGRAMRYEQTHASGAPLRIGVLGLGTGSIAAYCRDRDTFVFYEIDRRIQTIATSYFSYVPRCKGSEVRIGDGRILLEQERERGEKGAYDMIVVDAFSDDTIPVHLMTLEAFELYAAHLKDTESILAVHVSNRYLDLPPVVLRLAADLGFNAMVVRDDGESNEAGSGSVWVLLTQDADVFHSIAFANTDSEPPPPAEKAWRDDYSAIAPVIDVPLPWANFEW